MFYKAQAKMPHEILETMELQSLYDWLGDEAFQQPAMRGDKYICSEGLHDCHHGWEGFQIFCETQLKRLGRGLTLNLVDTFKYFAHHETDADIYQFDKPNFSKDNISIQNIGHASQLFNFNGTIILTDPVFNGLNSILYPAKTKNGVEIDDLVKVDIVLGSHNHRDHADESSQKKLAKMHPESKIFVPIGDGKLFEGFGFKKQNISEAQWYDSFDINNVTITAVPADHWSGRNGLDMQNAATNGWIINNDSALLYFAGDTAKLSEQRIKNIAAILYSKFANSDVNDINLMLPDGPNRTRSMMESTHMSIIESIMTVFEIAAKLHEIDSIVGDKRSISWWLSKLKTTIMHHNKYELGPDVFNEGYWIIKQVQDELEFINNCNLPVDKAKDLLQEKASNEESKWHFWLRKNDAFIYDGIIHMIEFAQQKMNKKDMLDISEFLQKILSSVKWPKIGERVDL